MLTEQMKAKIGQILAQVQSFDLYANEQVIEFVEDPKLKKRSSKKTKESVVSSNSSGS